MVGAWHVSCPWPARAPLLATAHAHGEQSVLFLALTQVPGSKVPVETWVLAYGGVGIVLGLATYGW